MKTPLFLTAAIVAVVAISSSSCKKDSSAAPATTPTTPTTPSGPSLYSQVGGTTLVTDPANPSTKIEQGYLTLRSVVDSSIYVIAADTRINSYFEVLLAEVGSGNTTGFVALSNNLTNFMATATGSTNPAYQYAGKSMTDAHNPATNSRINGKVTATAFNDFVGDVGVGLAQNGVTSPKDSTLINSLVALLNTTMGAVVQN